MNRSRLIQRDRAPPAATCTRPPAVSRLHRPSLAPIPCRAPPGRPHLAGVRLAGIRTLTSRLSPRAPRSETRHHDHLHTSQPRSATRIAAAALAALGAASAIPIPLAQFDFAGLINVFNIEHGDSPHALLVIAAVGGVLTVAVLALAFTGAFLAATGAPSARTALIAAALAGLVTAMPLWIPAGMLIGAAALLLGDPANRHAIEAASHRKQLRTTGVTTRPAR